MVHQAKKTVKLMSLSESDLKDIFTNKVLRVIVGHYGQAMFKEVY
jgi:hypothetical protein